MLIDVISNLKIDDATQRTEIIESISAIYARLNQSRAALKKHTSQLMAVEGEAEFHSQIKLLEQSVVNYLDVCDTPAKCDEYLTKMMVQIEELEGRFAEFEQFLTELADRRQQVYSAFDNRKVVPCREAQPPRNLDDGSRRAYPQRHRNASRPARRDQRHPQLLCRRLDGGQSPQHRGAAYRACGYRQSR